MLSEVCCYIRAMVAAPASASPWTTVFKLFGRFFTFIPKPILSENSTALLLYRGMYQLDFRQNLTKDRNCVKLSA